MRGGNTCNWPCEILTRTIGQCHHDGDAAVAVAEDIGGEVRSSISPAATTLPRSKYNLEMCEMSGVARINLDSWLILSSACATDRAGATVAGVCRA